MHVILSINGGNYDWECVEPDSANADFSKDNWMTDNGTDLYALYRTSYDLGEYCKYLF